MDSNGILNPRLLICADAGPKIGIGHVMRCIAVAQAWMRLGGACGFAVSDENIGVEKAILAEGLEVHRVGGSSLNDPAGLIALAASLTPAAIVIDGYRFRTDFQSAIKRAGYLTLVIDDVHDASECRADILADPRPYDQEHASPHPSMMLLSGIGYLPLRRQFTSLPDRRKPIRARALRVLVTIGGADITNSTASILRQLRRIPEPLEIKVVLGQIAAGRPEILRPIQDAIALYPSGRVQLEIATQDMPTLMQWSDIAISAAGGTSWELAYMGVPSILISVADNQIPNVTYLSRKQAAVYLGAPDQVELPGFIELFKSMIDDVALRTGLSLKSQALIDGGGARRIASTLWIETQIASAVANGGTGLTPRWASMIEGGLQAGLIQSSGGQSSKPDLTSVEERTAIGGQEAVDDAMRASKRRVVFRNVRREDGALLWEWRNQIDVRRSAFNTEPIALEDHIAWLERRLVDPECHFMIGSNPLGEPVGQVRFDMRGESSEIDISVAASKRGEGWGLRLLLFAVLTHFWQNKRQKRVIALVKFENLASQRLFEAAGFQLTTQKDVKGCPVNEYEYRRPQIRNL